MLNQFLEKFNENLNYFKKITKFDGIKVRKYLTKITLYFILFIFIIIFLDVNLTSFNNLLHISLNKPENFFLILLEGGFVFIVNILINLKMSLIVFIYGFLFSFFNYDYNFDIYSFLLNMSNQFKFHGSNNSLKSYYDFFIYDNELSYYFFNLDYLYSKKFKKIIILNSNLPIFFYFGVVFILTTIFSFLLLSYLGLYGVFFLNLVSIIFFWFSSILYFNSFYIDNCFYKFSLGKWFIISHNYIVNFDILIDSISYSFMFLTLTIAVFVYVYAFSYFRYEPNVERLILLINCFVISMILLVTSGNFFVLFLGWELIGLTSFFLINFWSTRISTLKAAFKAFVFNKFSDVSLLIAIFLIFFCINDISIISFNNQISNYNNYFLNVLDINFSIIEIISFFLISCAFVKSAQFGFHIWLPDSMEAPVPASALIHSATLVSAGVFILLRLSNLFEYSIYSYYIIPIIGSFTAFFGGLCSVYQSDIKKILAYSTISHCGFLMVCYSTYIPEYTVLYLYIHGFFKAAVFLCVGNIIRFSRNYQDFRKMGGFWKYLPFECFSSFICLINLCGLPFTLGYYIKHLLLIGVYMNNFYLYFILANILGGAVFGLIYSYRLFYYVFFDFKKAKKIIYLQSNRLNLKSIYFTNTTLASNLSISLLIVVAYVTSIYMFSIFLNSSSLGEGLDIYSVHPSQYQEFNSPVLTTINNIGYFNWLLLIIILSIITFSWRLVNNYFNIFNNLSFILIFFVFFYIFYNILLI